MFLASILALKPKKIIWTIIHYGPFCPPVVASRQCNTTTKQGLSVIIRETLVTWNYINVLFMPLRKATCPTLTNIIDSFSAGPFYIRHLTWALEKSKSSKNMWGRELAIYSNILPMWTTRVCSIMYEKQYVHWRFLLVFWTAMVIVMPCSTLCRVVN